MKNKRKSFFLGQYLIYFYFQIKTNFSAHSDKKIIQFEEKLFVIQSCAIHLILLLLILS